MKDIPKMLFGLSSLSSSILLVLVSSAEKSVSKAEETLVL